MLHISGSRRERNIACTSRATNDLPSLVVDVEDQMARSVAKTLRVCSGWNRCTNVLYRGTEAVIAVTEQALILN